MQIWNELGLPNNIDISNDADNISIIDIAEIRYRYIKIFDIFGISIDIRPLHSFVETNIHFTVWIIP